MARSKKASTRKKHHKRNVGRIARKTVTGRKMPQQDISAPRIGIKRNDTVKLIIILALIFITGVVVTSAIYINHRVMDYIVLNTSVRVTDYPVAGINADSSSLIFGKTYPGGGGTRYFNIMSRERALVNIRTTGRMAKFLSFSDNSFMIESGDNITITANLDIPKGVAPGNYTGKVHVYFLKP